MFGKNPLREKTTDGQNLAIESVFYTIQGEGPYQGCPALFIRMAGCNLACHFCDTQFETQAENLIPLELHINRIMSLTNPRQRRLVVLTGGEPLRQNIVPLIEALLISGTEIVQIETAGTLWQDGLERLVTSGRVVIVCSPKTPKVSALVEANCHHWKYIITAGQQSIIDGLPCVGTQVATKNKGMRIFRPDDVWTSPGKHVIWVSPCDSYDPKQNKLNQDAARNTAMQYGYRLTLQIHKIIGVE